MKVIIYILVFYLFIISCLSQNTLKKYQGVVVPPLPDNINATAGWRCNVIGQKIGTVNIASSNPGIYIYFATKSSSFCANSVTYIGKADKSISMKLHYHQISDLFCTPQAENLGKQNSCGYCYRPTYEGDTNLKDYDTYFYEAILLMTICAEGNSAESGGKFPGQTCDLLNKAPVDVLLTTNKLISYQLNTLVQNYIAPSNQTKSAPPLLPMDKNNAQFRDFAKMVKTDDSSSTPRSDPNPDPDYFTFATLKTHSSLFAALNGLLNYSVFTAPPTPCVVEDLDQFMGRIMQNKIELWCEINPQNSSQSRDGSRLICYGTFERGFFTLNQSFCEVYLYTGSVQKGGKYIQNIMVDLVVKKVDGYLVKFSSEFERGLDYVLKSYYGSDTEKIESERNAVLYLTNSFAAALNKAGFEVLSSLPPPLPSC